MPSITSGVPYFTDSDKDVYTDLGDVAWRTVDVLGEYQLVLPDPLASWDVFGYWERERFGSMAANLNHGDVLFDVGTEQGWCNLIYAQSVGAENMVLVEPTRQFWPNVKATWERNYPGATPRLCYDGLLSSETNDARTSFDEWPACSGGPLIDRNKYQYIWDHADNVGEMRLDDLVARSGIAPDAVTIDVEGAELAVLQGGWETLVLHRPLVWCSVHPDLMQRHYRATDSEFHDFMADLGYTGRHLATDHEQHWLYEPR